MAKIIIYHEKHNQSFFQKYWGLIIFPLLPFWALSRDDGMAGYLDIDGVSYKLKYNKKMHPQIINIPAGQHEIVYRKTSKLAIAFNAWATETSGAFGAALDSLEAFDDFKLRGFVANFGHNTELKLQGEGGVLRNIKIIDVINAPDSTDRQAQTAGHTPTPPKKSKGFGAAFICALVVFLIAGIFLLNEFNIIKPNKNDTYIPNASVSTNADLSDKSDDESLNKTMYIAVRETVLNLRTAPSTDSQVITTMPKGDIVTVHSISGDWAYVTYKGTNGYCSTNYLSEHPPITTSDTTDNAVALKKAIIGQWQRFSLNDLPEQQDILTVSEWTFNPDNSCSVSENYCDLFTYGDERKTYNYDGKTWYVGSGHIYRGIYSLDGDQLTVIMDVTDPGFEPVTTTTVYTISLDDNVLSLYNNTSERTFHYQMAN